MFRTKSFLLLAITSAHAFAVAGAAAQSAQMVPSPEQAESPALPPPPAPSSAAPPPTPSSAAPPPAAPSSAEAPLVDLTGEGAMQAPPPAVAVPPPAPVEQPAPVLLAPRERYNAINLSLLGFAIGRVRLTYERMVTRKHGVFAEAFVAPDIINGVDYVGYGGAIGYRWHWKGPGDSGFVGATVALERAEGELDVIRFGDEDVYRYAGRVLSLSIVPHVGKRWVFRSGVNLTVRVGFGYAPVLSNDPKPSAEAEAVDIVDDRWFGVDGEASVGYSF